MAFQEGESTCHENVESPLRFGIGAKAIFKNISLCVLAISCSPKEACQVVHAECCTCSKNVPAIGEEICRYAVVPKQMGHVKSQSCNKLASARPHKHYQAEYTQEKDSLLKTFGQVRELL